MVKNLLRNHSKKGCTGTAKPVTEFTTRIPCPLLPLWLLTTQINYSWLSAQFDESIEEAALRELEEETGIKGTVTSLVDFFAQRSPFHGALLIFGYRVNIVGGEMKAGDDAQEVGFFDFNNLPPIAFLSHQALLRKEFGKLIK